MAIELHLGAVARPTVVVAGAAVTFTLVNAILILLASRFRIPENDESSGENGEANATG